jgi:hypothetical protein
MQSKESHLNQELDGNGGASYLKFVLEGRRRLLKESLVEDADGQLRADFGNGVKRYSLCQLSGEGENVRHLKNQLFYGAAVSLQHLLDHPERPGFHYACELLRLNLAAANCFEGEYFKEEFEASMDAISKQNSQNARQRKNVITQEMKEEIRTRYWGHLENGLTDSAALNSATDEVNSKFGHDNSPTSFRRYL